MRLRILSILFMSILFGLWAKPAQAQGTIYASEWVTFNQTLDLSPSMPGAIFYGGQTYGYVLDYGSYNHHARVVAQELIVNFPPGFYPPTGGFAWAPYCYGTAMQSLCRWHHENTRFAGYSPSLAYFTQYMPAGFDYAAHASSLGYTYNTDAIAYCCLSDAQSRSVGSGLQTYASQGAWFENVFSSVVSIEIQMRFWYTTPLPATATPNSPTGTPYIEPSPIIPPYFATATATRTPFGIPTATLLPLATADGGNFTAFVTQQWRPEMRSYGWDVPALGVLVPVTQAPAPTVDPTRGAIVTNMQGMNSTLEAQISMLNATPTAWLLPDGTTFSVAAQDEEFENLLLLLFAYIKGLDAEDWGQLAPLITLTVGILIYMVLIQAFNIVWRILTTIFSIIFSLFKSVIGFVRG